MPDDSPQGVVARAVRWGRASAAGLAVLTLSFALVPPAQAAPSDGIHNIQHVVMIMQENRSFDSYFGTYPGANGIPSGVCLPDPRNGGCLRPYHNSSDKNYGGGHGTIQARRDIDGGKMDGFVGSAQAGCTKLDPACKPLRSVPS